MLGYVFKLFSTNPLVQLTFLSPLLLISICVALPAVARIKKYNPSYRQILGYSIQLTLLAYAVLILMILMLQPTGTSFGQPQPVIIVFGALYLFSLAVGLGVMAFPLGSKKVKKSWYFWVGGYGLAHLGLLLLLGYGHYIEPFWLDVTHTEIKTAPADSSVEPLKVVLISDIHMERWTRREDDALAKINALEPDLLFVSGDHINLDYVKPETYSDIRRFFIGLKARYGIYAVGGTVDDIKETREALSGLAVVFLNDEIARLNVKGREIEVLGIRSDYMDDERILREMSPRLNPAALKILLYHTPDLAPVAAETGINLYLAGHTHGGQVALPFFGAVFTASKYGRKYASGLYNLGGANQTKMYVTRGLGFEGYNTIRMRLFARPEITALNLQ